MEIKTFEENGFDKTLFIDLPQGQATRYIYVLMLSYDNGRILVEATDFEGRETCCNGSSFSNIDIRVYYDHQKNTLTIEERETMEVVDYHYDMIKGTWIKGTAYDSGKI